MIALPRGIPSHIADDLSKADALGAQGVALAARAALAALEYLAKCEAAALRENADRVRRQREAYAANRRSADAARRLDRH